MEFYRKKPLFAAAEEEATMFEDPFNPYKQPDKLILPAVPTEEYYPPEYLVHAEQRPFQAGGLIRKNPPPAARPAGPLHKKFTYLWHRDPAYKVLFIAVGVVLASSIVSIVLLACFVNQLSPSPAPMASLPAKMQATPTLAPTPQPTAISTPIPTPIPTQPRPPSQPLHPIQMEN